MLLLLEVNINQIGVDSQFRYDHSYCLCRRWTRMEEQVYVRSHLACWCLEVYSIKMQNTDDANTERIKWFRRLRLSLSTQIITERKYQHLFLSSRVFAYFNWLSFRRNSVHYFSCLYSESTLGYMERSKNEKSWILFWIQCWKVLFEHLSETSVTQLLVNRKETFGTSK